MNIIRLSGKEDLNKYFEGLAENGLVNYSTSAFKKYYWQFKQNPFYLTQDPAVWLCSLDGKTVGHLGAIPVELKVGFRNIQAAWAVDFATLPEYRRKGIGKFLVREANKHFELFLALGTTDMSFGLFTKMGWKLLGDLPYYIKILDLKSLLKEKIKNIFVIYLSFIPVSFLLWFLNLFKENRKRNDIKLRMISNFNEETDLLWNEIRDSYKVIVPRGKAYLNWKYDMQPGMDYIKFRAERGNKIYGYAVVRCIKSDTYKPKGLITDILVRPDDKDVIQALILGVLEYLKNQGCSIVRCYASQRQIQKSLKGCGMIRRRSCMRFMVKKNIEDAEEVEKLDNWYITAGDSDIDH